jgi:hypothetical protein
MTQKSYFWSCSDIGDGGVDSFSQESVMTFLGMMGMTYSPALSGIIPWKSGNTTILEQLGFPAFDATPEMEIEYDSTPPRLIVHPGLAMSGGQFYVNTAPIIFGLIVGPSGLANAYDRIVLRRDLVSQTVRLVYVQATAPSTTAPLQQDATYWDVPIARIRLDGSGDYLEFLDDRRYVNSTSAGRILLAEFYHLGGISPGSSLDVTYDNIGQLYQRLEVEVFFDRNSGTSVFNMRFNGDSGPNYYPGANTEITTSLPSARNIIYFELPMYGVSKMSPYFKAVYRKLVGWSGGIGGSVITDDIRVWQDVSPITSIRFWVGTTDASDDEILVRVYGIK